MTLDSSPSGDPEAKTPGWNALPVVPSAETAVKSMHRFRVRERREGYVQKDQLDRSPDQYTFTVEEVENGTTTLLSFLLHANQGRLRLAVSQTSPDGPPTQFLASMYPETGRKLALTPDQASKLPVKFPQ